MNRDAIEAELLEIEGILQHDRLKDEDRMPCTARNKHCAMSWIGRPGTLPRRPFIGSMADRSKPAPRW